VIRIGKAYINNTFKSNQCHTNGLGEEEEGEKAVLADDGAEELLMNGHKGPQDGDDLPCVSIIEDWGGSVHLTHILIDGIGDLNET
jgi:hypothetical protein